jgi:hypothetical protein
VVYVYIGVDDTSALAMKSQQLGIE